MTDPLVTGQRLNDLGQPIGLAIDYSPAPRPDRSPMQGRYCAVVPMEMAHAKPLFDIFAEDTEGRIWTYLPNGPYTRLAEYEAWAEQAIAADDPLMHTILVDGQPMGHASFLRIDPAQGAIEVGFINLSPRLQRTRAATEFQFLMMKRAFELGYRRYEWKCDALNAPSRAAATRLGFTYEGTFRQATHYKGRNRDTAWFSILDSEWPALKTRFETWLSPDNFDADGQQKARL